MRARLLSFFLLFLISNLVSAQEKVSIEQVVMLALQNNYDVRIQENIVEAASTDVRYQYGAFVPQLNANGAIVKNYNDQELRFQDESRNNQGEARSTAKSASLQLNWTLFDGTRMFAARSIINETEAQARLQLQDQMVNTIAVVIQNYYNIVRQKQQLKALQEQMAVNEVRVTLAERKFQVGTGAKPELLQARVDYNEQRTQALQQEALIQQLKEQLDASVNQKLPKPFDVSDTIIIDLSIQQEELIENIENRNYTLQAARSGLSIARDNIWAQRATGLPSLSFNAAYNYSQQDNTLLINPFGPTYNLTTGLNAGFSVTIPILNNYNNTRLIQQARIFSRRQELLYDQQNVNVNASLKNAFTDYDFARKVLQVEEENILLARENVNIALEVFRRGASTFVELRTAQQSLADAYTRLINARYLAKVAETELLRLNGSLLK
jgi:outer membrane protein